jgi:hypothetical protein
MLTGDSTQRKSDNLGKKMQQCYRCYTEENWGGSMYSPCMDPELDTDHFPKQPCAGGIRSNIIFPLYAKHQPATGTESDTFTDAGTERISTVRTTRTTSLTLLAGPLRSLLSAASAPTAIRLKSRRSCWRCVRAL